MPILLELTNQLQKSKVGKTKIANNAEYMFEGQMGQKSIKQKEF